MSKNSAEYMRAYRARKKLDRQPLDIDKRIENYRRVILELEDEVRSLKTELASRTMPLVVGRKTQQACRDAILRKINSRPK